MVVGLLTVPLIVTVTPLQGSGAAVPPPFLLQEYTIINDRMKKVKNLSVKKYFTS